MCDSKTTKSEDQGTKRGLYAYLGVAEYWQYDPTGSYLQPQLYGFRLEGENYVPIGRPHPFGTDYCLQSAVLGLEIHLRDGELRFRDPKTGRFLLNHSENTVARHKADVARHEAETARHEAEAAQQEAEAARHKAEAAQHEAEQQARAETERRQSAEAKIAELETGSAVSDHGRNAP